MAEFGLTKNQILSELSRSPHGKLSEYVEVGKKAASTEPEFYSHLIAWDKAKGQIRDAKVALPIIGLSVPMEEELRENSLAHLALLNPRELERALRFGYSVKVSVRSLRKLVQAYLREKEEDKHWDRLALQHRKVLKSLYALTHLKPSPHAKKVLFEGVYRKGSLFDTVANLGKMSTTEAAAAIINEKIPFLIAKGALGKKANEPELVLAMLDRMSPTEVVTNTKMLERLGVKTNPMLKGAFEKALEKASQSKSNLLKTTRAAEAIEDETLKAKLRGVQDRQLQNMGVEGNWLVLGDCSGSMEQSIETAKEVAATLAKMVKGKVWLVFFNTSPQTIDVTGMSLDVIKNVTKYIRANGGTSIGCGLYRMLESKTEIDGIAIVSDGGENQSPYFSDVYRKYSEWAGKEVPVYFYHVPGQYDSFSGTMNAARLDLQMFDLTKKAIDFYALPNLVQTMRTNRYSLVDEVMATPLLKINDVLKQYGKEKAHVESV